MSTVAEARAQEQRGLMLLVLLLVALMWSLPGCALQLDHVAAMSEDYMAEEPLTRDVDAELAKAKDEIEALGFSLVERVDGVERATTLWSEVWLPVGFGERPPDVRLMLLRHELRHIRQWKALGVVVFGGMYTVDRNFTWLMEMYGVRQELRDRVDLGHSRADVVAWLEAKSKSFPKKYSFPAHHRRAVREATRTVLLEELERYWPSNSFGVTPKTRQMSRRRETLGVLSPRSSLPT